jgi:hypothetical protein
VRPLNLGKIIKTPHTFIVKDIIVGRLLLIHE